MSEEKKLEHNFLRKKDEKVQIFRLTQALTRVNQMKYGDLVIGKRDAYVYLGQAYRSCRKCFKGIDIELLEMMSFHSVIWDDGSLMIDCGVTNHLEDPIAFYSEAFNKETPHKLLNGEQKFIELRMVGKYFSDIIPTEILKHCQRKKHLVVWNNLRDFRSNLETSMYDD